MKIAIISDASSIHTARWANGLLKAGHEVHVISQHKPQNTYLPEVKLHIFSNYGVLGYFLMAYKTRKILKAIKPDVTNAHYASGYGTTARLSKVTPVVLSVWGTDIYVFPYKSKFHKYLVKKNIAAADAIASTSHCMAEQIRKISPSISKIFITPFGIDLAQFNNLDKIKTNKNNQKIIIGTVKTMSETYGIDILINAFALLNKSLNSAYPNLSNEIHLRLVGGGPQTHQLQKLTQTLGIEHKVEFIGQVPHKQVPIELAQLDIYVALSREESFGVAVLEAGAARLPVVVSEAAGLAEVTLHEQTGIIVPVENPDMAAEAMTRLILNPSLRKKLGEQAYQHVSKTYNWDHCVQIMENVYLYALQKYGK